MKNKNTEHSEAHCIWKINWDEENRSNYKPLHIGDSGERIANATGVSFLNRRFLAAAHHAAGRVAIFDLTREKNPIYTFDAPFTVDDIASKKLSEWDYEIIVSGNWAAHYAAFSLRFDEISLKPSTKLMGVCGSPAVADKIPKTFSHSVFYIKDAICVCLHTGHDPRVDINHGESTIRLPAGFYPTGACWDDSKKHMYIGANHQAPTEDAFIGSSASIWRFEAASRSIKRLITFDSCHVDSLALCNGKLWFNNQYKNLLMSIDIENHDKVMTLSSEHIGFPHGIDIFEDKYLAVANYRPSSIAIFDISAL